MSPKPLEKLSGAWLKLHNWLMLDAHPDSGDHEAEALAIVNAAMEGRLRGRGQGCVTSSLSLMQCLLAGLEDHLVQVESGTVQGRNVYGTGTPRLWMKIETLAYAFENVAWWWGVYRHQAVLITPRSDDRGFLNPTATLIDLWGPAGKVWQPWGRWSGGMERVDKTVGRVRDGF